MSETLAIYCWLLNLKYYVARLGLKGEKEENRTIEIKYFSRFGGREGEFGGVIGMFSHVSFFCESHHITDAFHPREETFSQKA